MANRIDVVAVFAFLLSLSLRAGAAPPTQASGVVLDRETRQPVAGAYVLATYYEIREGSFVVAKKCVKTRGMYTGSDGRYSFPLERTDGTSPGVIATIKADYQGGIFEPAHKPDRSRQPRDFFDSVILISRQNPSNPDFTYGTADEECIGAPTPRDAAAGTEWLRIELQEREKYGITKPAQESLRKTIKDREALEGAVK